MAISEGTCPTPTQRAYGTSGTATSGSFSPDAGSWVVVLVAWLFGNTTTTTLTCQDSNGNSYTAGPGSNVYATTTKIFSRYYASAPGSITVTVTSTSTAGASVYLAPRVVNGAASSQSGAGSGTSATQGYVSVSATAAGSWIYVVAGDGTNITPTVRTDCTQIGYWSDTDSGDTGMAGRLTNATTGSGSYTVGWSSGGEECCALEILASTSTAKSSSDAASAAEAQSLRAALAGAEAVQATEAQSLRAALAGAEAVQATEAQSLPGIRIVQHKQWTSGSTSSFSFSLDNSTTAGNTLILVCSSPTAGRGPSSVTLGGSADNWEKAYDPTNGYNYPVYWWDPDCAGGQSTIAGNLEFGADTPCIDVIEVAGLGSSPTVDRTVDYLTSAGGPTWTSTATSTTTAASELVVGAVGGYGGATTTITGPSSPWTNYAQGTPVANTFGMLGYQIVSSTGTFTYSGTSNRSSPNLYAAAAVVTFIPSAPSGPSGPGTDAASASESAGIRASLADADAVQAGDGETSPDSGVRSDSDAAAVSDTQGSPQGNRISAEAVRFGGEDIRIIEQGPATKFSSDAARVTEGNENPGAQIFSKSSAESALATESGIASGPRLDTEVVMVTDSQSPSMGTRLYSLIRTYVR